MLETHGLASGHPERPADAAVRPARILSTLYWPKRAAWVSRVDSIDRAELSTLGVSRTLLASASRYDAVVLDGASGGAVRLTGDR